jgi:hypothetical protein
VSSWGIVVAIGKAGVEVNFEEIGRAIVASSGFAAVVVEVVVVGISCVVGIEVGRGAFGIVVVGIVEVVEVVEVVGIAVVIAGVVVGVRIVVAEAVVGIVVVIAGVVVVGVAVVGEDKGIAENKFGIVVVVGNFVVEGIGWENTVAQVVAGEGKEIGAGVSKLELGRSRWIDCVREQETSIRWKEVGKGWRKKGLVEGIGFVWSFVVEGIGSVRSFVVAGIGSVCFVLEGRGCA